MPVSLIWDYKLILDFRLSASQSLPVSWNNYRGNPIDVITLRVLCSENRTSALPVYHIETYTAFPVVYVSHWNVHIFCSCLCITLNRTQPFQLSMYHTETYTSFAVVYVWHWNVHSFSSCLCIILKRTQVFQLSMYHTETYTAFPVHWDTEIQHNKHLLC